LDLFTITGSPILLGISRKSMIHRTLQVSAEESLNGSTVLHTLGLLKGATILRTHDVKEAMETIRLIEALPQKK
jgi:dihydropteroate synthase